MPASPADSAIYRGVFGDADVAALFTDTAEVRAMMLVLGALARAQAEEGLIPQESADAIHRAGMEIQIDPGALASLTAENGVPIPALVAQFRAEMQSPEHSQYLHWGATSQDIMDTALMLRLRQTLAILDVRLQTAIAHLGALAGTHADLPMPARTYGQIATPTSFGAVVAGWGEPLLRHRAKLEGLCEAALCVSLSGAAGTLSVMGEAGPGVRARLATGLGLGDPGASWHSTRDRIADLAGWLCGISASLGKMGQDVILMAQSGIDEVTLSGGASSTMPQKSNPIGPSVLVAIAAQMAALNSAVQRAGVHGAQRDGAAWFTEWLSLPQMSCLAGRATALGETLAAGISPNSDAMARNFGTLGLAFAEALSFALAQDMPRPEAQALVKSLATEAITTGVPLRKLAENASGRDLAEIFDPARQLGQAPAEARAFAAAATAT